LLEVKKVIFDEIVVDVPSVADQRTTSVFLPHPWPRALAIDIDTNDSINRSSTLQDARKLSKANLYWAMALNI